MTATTSRTRGSARKGLRQTTPTCGKCGMVLDHVAEFHPFVFCVLKKAGRDPWADFRSAVRLYGLGELPSRPPPIKDLPKARAEGQ